MIRFYVEWDCEAHERVELFGNEIIELDEDAICDFWKYADGHRYERLPASEDQVPEQFHPFIIHDYYFAICELFTDITGYLVRDYELLDKEPDDVESEFETRFRKLWDFKKI